VAVYLGLILFVGVDKDWRQGWVRNITYLIRFCMHLFGALPCADHLPINKVKCHSRALFANKYELIALLCFLSSYVYVSLFASFTKSIVLG